MIAIINILFSRRHAIILCPCISWSGISIISIIRIVAITIQCCLHWIIRMIRRKGITASIVVDGLIVFLKINEMLGYLSYILSHCFAMLNRLLLVVIKQS